MSLKTVTILYVEDSRLMREKIKNLLEPLVKEIYFAQDGKEGLYNYRKYEPDIVIADINMPVMDGLKMAELIKKIEPKQHIVLLTSLDDSKSLKRAIEIGIDSFISKPFSDEDILHKLDMLALNIKNEDDAKKLKKLQLEKEKADLILKMIQEISHHWRQPLSTILSLSSSNIIKKELGVLELDELVRDMEKISRNIEQLSDILNRIENIDVKKENIEDIEKLIQISNPIYYNK